MRKFISLAILLASLLIQNAVAENNANSATSWTNVSYSSVSSTCKLDIFLPSSGSGPFPTVIWIHGGAFKMGSKDNPQSKTALNNAGFAVVSINYRLTGEAKWPAQLEDLKACVKFLKTNAATYSINPNKMASWGASAGAHLACMMGAALTSDPATRIQATVSWFPPMSFFHMDADIALAGTTRCTGANGDASSPESVLLGVTVKDNEAACYKASPISFVDTLNLKTPLPNFLLMHGGKDCNIGANQSVRFHNAITKRFGNTKSQYIFLANGTHGGGDFSLTSTETTVINFLKAQFLNTNTVDNSNSKDKARIVYSATNKTLSVSKLKNETQDTGYQLYNTSGTLIKTGLLNAKPIDVNGLNGIYCLVLKSNNQTIDCQKVLIR